MRVLSRMLRSKCRAEIAMLLVLLILPAHSFAQAWSGIIDPARAIDWSQAGIPGGLPSSTWTQCGPTIAAYNGTGTAIINALAHTATGYTSCGTNTYIQLGAGTFNLTSGIAFPFNTTGHNALRGMGANSTFLVFSNSASGCNAGQSAFICIQSNDGTAPGNGGLSIVNWTGGTAKGATQLTLSSVSGIVAGQTLLMLNQCDTGFSGATCGTGSAIDNGDYFVCSALYNGSTGCSVNGPDGNTWRANAWQQETVLVTAINAGGCGATCVTIAQPIEHPNWTASQSPQAVIMQPVPQDGIENLTIDGTPTTSVGAAITIFNAYQCWVSGVKIVNAYAYGVYMLDVSHAVVKDNYFYRSNGHPDAYAVRVAWGGDDLIQNNIFQQWKNSYATDGPAPGEVLAYNFSVNQLVPSPNDFMWTAYWSHSAGDDFHLREGNAGNNDQEDNTHGSHLNITKFRNFFWGWESCANGSCGTSISKTLPLDANIDSSNVRYANLIGNVLGTPPDITTIYEHSVAFGSNAAFDIGAGNGNSSLPTDPLVRSTMLRWGNYDVHTDVVHWCGNSGDTGWSTTCGSMSEVPSGITPYPNPIPAVGDTGAGQPAMPASFYLSSKPLWFGAVPWPAIGPDVSGGNVGQCSGTKNTPGQYAGVAATSNSQCVGTSLVPAWAGHVNANPAMNCYLNMMGGPPDGTGSELSFDPSLCYSSGQGGSVPNVAQTCNGAAFGATSQNCSGFGSVGASDILVVMAWAGAGTTSVSGCGAIWTVDPTVSGAAMATGVNPTAGSCTPVCNSTASTSISCYGVDVTGSSGIDQRAATISEGFFQAGATITGPSVTTTGPNRLVLGLFVDTDGNNATYTAGTPFSLVVTGPFATLVEGDTQSTTGTIAPTCTYNHTTGESAATVALKP